MGTYYKVIVGIDKYKHVTKDRAISFAREKMQSGLKDVLITKIVEEKVEIPVIFYKAGDRFEWYGSECVLAQVDYGKYTLVNIETGNRTACPLTPKVDHKVSEAEMEQLTGGGGFKVISIRKRKTI
jgi:hypothetical protein